MDLCSAVLEFFRTGKLLKQLNHTIIALIPKVSHNPSVGDFRPIACCNVIYKIITKILSKRLITIVKSVVGPSQSAFIQGRNITDNIFLAQELFRHYSCKKYSPRCALKIDLTKAYDSISWAFLSEVLTAFGCPLVFVQWIMECVSTATYSLSINGSIHGFIAGKRGLRQGDPISPSLFLICMEYFSRLLAKRTFESDFNFHPKCEKLRITHLAFADDLLLFTRGDFLSVRILMQALDDFGDASGLRVNGSKSAFFSVGIKEPDLARILSVVRMPARVLPVRYLGVPLAAQRLKVADFSPLISKLVDKVNSWASKTLSYAGRLELIRSVLQGVECYWIQIFPLPVSVIDRVTQICRAFLWGSKKTPVAWSDCCIPVDEGGLGLRDIQSWNLALLAKNIWNIHTKVDSLWIRWIHEEYLGGISVWSWSVKAIDSPLFKKLNDIRDRILSSCGGNVDVAVALIQDWFAVPNASSKAYEWFRSKNEPKPWKRFFWQPFIPHKYSFIS